MKKISVILLALAMMLTFFGCDYVSRAEKLIGQEKYEQAYKLLYKNKSDEKAAEMLEDFVWVCEKQTETDYDGDVSTSEYTYDADGNLTKGVYTLPSGFVNTCEYTYYYDIYGNIAKEVCTNSEGHVTTVEYTYDANGNLKKQVRADLGGFGDTTEWTYDAEGNITKQVYTGPRYSYSYEYTHYYDADGNKVKEILKDSDSGITIENIYDANGNLTKEVHTDSGSVRDTTKYTYDAEGNLIREVNEDLYNGTAYEYIYYYDADGNLTKKVFANSEGNVTTTEYTGYKVFYKPQKSK